MKIFSFIAIAVSISLTSCSTKRFEDIAPETRGTALGDVSIGKENRDYFVVPSPRTPDGGGDESPASVVVFKTKERHPTYRAVHLAGAPVRTVNKVGSTVIGGGADIVGAIFSAPFREPQAPNAGWQQPSVGARPAVPVYPTEETHGPVHSPAPALVQQQPVQLTAPVLRPQLEKQFRSHPEIAHTLAANHSHAHQPAATASNPATIHRSTSYVLHRARPNNRKVFYPYASSFYQSY